MLRSIALLRGFSALFVVLYHAVYYEGRVLHGTSLAFEAVAGRLSVCGVTTFFCLSGYLMARLVETESFGHFTFRRFLRIYPAFLAAVVLAVIAAHLGLLSMGDFPLVALTLFPVGEIERPLGVEWTLVYEIFYYALASLFCFAPTRRFFPTFIALWTAIVVTAFLGFDMVGSTFQPDLAHVAFSIWNLGFLVGALGRFAERAGWARPVWVVPGLVVLAVSEVWGIGLRHLFLPVGLGLIALGAIAWEVRRGGIQPPGWAIRLGDASYGIYLLHITVIRAVMAQVTPGPEWPTGLLSVVSFGLALAVTLPFGLAEHRMHRRLVRFFSSRPRPPDPRRHPVLVRSLAILLVLASLELFLQVASLFVSAPREAVLAPGDSDEIRILCVGDSNTFGAYVEPEESYPARLERILADQLDRSVRVVNVGEPGRNTAMMLRDLPGQLERHRPSVMIVLGGANNNWNVLQTEHWGRPGVGDFVDRTLSHLRLYKLLRLVGLALQKSPDTLDEQTTYPGTMRRDFLYRVTRNDAAEMIRLARAHGVIPILQSYFADFGYFPVFSAALEDAARDEGALFVDHSKSIERALAEMPRESFYFQDSHLRPPGYALVAANLANAILGKQGSEENPLAEAAVR